MVDTLGLVNAVAGAPSYNGRKLRQLNGVGFAGATAARPLGARSGVRPGTPASTVTATASTWTVQPHAGLIDGQTAAEAGAYPFAFDAVATGAVAAASASFARVDIIYVQVDDPSESDGSTVPAVTRKYLAGTVANTAPTLPARSILLAHINVPISAGGAPSVTWKAPYCAAVGAVVEFNTKAELDLWTTANPNQQASVLDTGAVYARISGAWVEMWTPGGRAFREAAGALLVAGNTTGNTAITFPAGRFTVPPIVTLVTSNVAVNMALNALNVTATGMTIQTYNTTSGSPIAGIGVHWTARQMTPTAAAG